MRVAAVGDIVGSAGVDFFCKKASVLRREYRADIIIVNAENSAYSGVGVTKTTAGALLAAGADILTTGNHAFRSRDYRELFEDQSLVLRPVNFAAGVAGQGVGIIDMGRYRLAVINLIGQSFMENADSYFDALDRSLAGLDTRLVIVDFHAEATAEKRSLGFYADGRISALFGTHTHVQTADNTVLPKGTGYISDVGMTGPEISVLGVEPSAAVQKQRLRIPTVFSVADGPSVLCAAVFDIDEQTGLCRSTERVMLR